MNILVIGAGKGIGLEATRKFINIPGATIVAVSRNTKNLEEMVPASRSYIVRPCDISDENDVQELIKHLKEISFNPERVLISAGVLIKKPFEELTGEDYRTCFDTNFFGVFLIIQRLIPLMKSDRTAHIVTIGSMGGVTGSLKFPGMVFYSSSKAALGCLTECLAEELQDKNIHVNCLALGAVETEMKNQAFPDYQAPHTAEEIAEYIADFTINGGSFFNGKVLPVSISVP